MLLLLLQTWVKNLIQAMAATMDRLATRKHPHMSIPSKAVEDTIAGTAAPKSPHTPTSADDGTAAATHNVDPAISETQ